MFVKVLIKIKRKHRYVKYAVNLCFVIFWKKQQLIGFFNSRITFKLPFFFRFPTRKWLVS